MSEGTNQERLQQNNEILAINNTKIQEAIQKVNNLPEYQDIQTIYRTSNYQSLDIENPNPGTYTDLVKVHTLDDYLIAGWRYVYNSYGNVSITNYYLYKKEDNAYKLLGITDLSASDTQAAIIGYTDKYVYIALGYRNSKGMRICNFELATKTYTTTSISTNNYLCNIIWSDGNGYFLTNRVNSGYLFYFDVNNPTIAPRRLLTINNNECVWNTQEKIFGYGANLTKLDLSETPIQINKSYTNITIRGVNFYGNKVFTANGIYELSSTLDIGDKISDTVVPSNMYCLNDKYYMSCIGGSNYNTITLWSFDEDTNEFISIESDSKSLNNGGYEKSPNFWANCYIYNFNTSNIAIGYSYEGHNCYFNKTKDTSTSNILTGYNAYNSAGNAVSGTMPNNGELNYTPSTEAQTIPAGYTSGGTIAASLMTQEEYNETLNIANQILGKEI